MELGQLEQIIHFYFIKPILEYEGYNIVNTFTYALIAIGAIYLIYTFIEKRKIKIDEDFFYGVIGFVLFGSFYRVCVDSVDNVGVYPAFWEVFRKHQIFEYSIYTTSPMIYVLVSLLFFISFYFEKKLNVKRFSFFIGSFLAFVCGSFLYFFLKYFWVIVLVLSVALVFSLIAKRVVKLKSWKYWLVIFAHSLDGAATYVAIEILPKVIGIRYQEQHVLPNIVAGVIPEFGFLTFFILKLIISTIAAKLLEREEEGNLKELVIISLIIIGLAPGIRDILRAALGV